jgi:hypothetical protein
MMVSRGKKKINLEEYMLHRNFDNHETHIKSLGIEPEAPRRKPSNYKLSSYGTAANN